MKRLFIFVMLALPFAAVAQETLPLPPDLPPLPEQGTFMAQVRTKAAVGGDGNFIYFSRTLGMGNWWKNSEVVKQISASDAQVQQIERIYQDSRLHLIDLKANLEKEEARLEPLVQADNPDERLISSQIDKVAAARGELEKANALMQVGIRKVLTLDQWKKLQSLQPNMGPGPFKIAVPVPPLRAPAPAPRALAPPKM